jgi:aspartate/methionine/tyrosine aminotransferase
MDVPPFRYMAWAKAHIGKAAYPLHMSGMPAVTLADLGVGLADLRLSRPPSDGPDAEVAAAVAARYGVPADCVLPCCGTHIANYLLAHALTGPGSRVLVESPNYEDLPAVFRVAGAEVTTFRRRREESWRLPIAEIRDGLSRGARVVAVTDLHNPSGARILPDDLAALEGAAREFDAHVLVDEVYRDFLPPPVGTSFSPGGPFVVSTSLTKVYGLGDLRMGWALAAPDVVRRMKAHDDYLLVNLPALSASVALAAWGRLDAVAARHRELAGANFRTLASWVRGRKDLLWSPPDGGISAFLEVPALRGKDDVAWVEGLLEATGVCVAPGSMFGEPGSFRVSFGMAGDRFREGLDRLGAHLDRAT